MVKENPAVKIDLPTSWSSLNPLGETKFLGWWSELFSLREGDLHIGPTKIPETF